MVRGELGWRKLKYDRQSLAAICRETKRNGVGEVAKNSGGGIE